MTERKTGLLRQKLIGPVQLTLGAGMFATGLGVDYTNYVGINLPNYASQNLLWEVGLIALGSLAALGGALRLGRGLGYDLPTLPEAFGNLLGEEGEVIEGFSPIKRARRAAAKTLTRK